MMTMTQKMSDWTFNGECVKELPTDIVGFVYLITNLASKKMYVGKKLSHFAKTKYKVVTLKDGTKKKKKIRYYEESDWREYWSSSDEVKKDVKLYGEGIFTRKILHYCSSKGNLSYMELKEQINRKVLESDTYYNGIIQVRIHKKHISKEAHGN